MEYNSEKICQKLSNYKIPLKTASSKDSYNASNYIDYKIDRDCKTAECQQIIPFEDKFSSPLSELGQELCSVQIEYSPIKRTCSNNNNHNNNNKKSIKQDEIAAKKRKIQPIKKPMFFGRDLSYPSDLNDLIQPLFCGLCNVHLNSVKSAVTHYESKTHDKKITNWLIEWSVKIGQPLPIVKRFTKDGPTDPDVFHCEACDLPLTSLQHASQHYKGRRHKMVISKRADPSGSGFYNSNGKWVRQYTKVKEGDSRFGIGDSFTTKQKEVLVEPVVPIVKENRKEEREDSLVKQQDPSKYCSICNITVTSVSQMQMHIQGTKHTKKLKLKGQVQPLLNGCETILASIKYPKNNDISIYRTPSGNYYCKICNVTWTEVGLFQQHLLSKKHSKNLKIKSVAENLS